MITREDAVEQSVTDHVKAALVANGYTPDKVGFRENFPQLEAGSTLPLSIVAAGFDDDREAEQAELGSDLLRRVYNFEFFVFGQTRTHAKNIANVVKFAIEEDGTVALKDLETGAEVDRLVVIGTSASRQIIPDPEPWQEFVWLTVASIEDTYHAGLS